MNYVACIGTFNGFHLGHISVIEKTVEVAKELKCTPLLIIIQKEQQVNITDQFISDVYLSRLKIKKHIVYELSKIKDIKGNDFINQIIKEYNLLGLIVGEDFQYGHDCDSNILSLEKITKEKNIFFYPVPLVKIDDKKIASSSILRLMENNDFITLNKMFKWGYWLSCSFNVLLGKIDFPYSINGKFHLIIFSSTNKKIKIENDFFIKENSFELEKWPFLMSQSKKMCIIVQNIK